MTDAPVLPGAPPAPPTNAAEARVRLDGLVNNKDFGAKLLSGDVSANREFTDLQAMVEKGRVADQVEAALSGDIGDMPDSSLKEMAGAADMLRDMGFNPLQVRETISGREASAAEVEMATRWKAQNLKSQEFQKRLLSGEPDAARQLMVANIILTSPLKKADAA
jgi:hypothetical protein